MKLDEEKFKKGKTTKELLNFGVINIDKPTGPTSFEISQFVKRNLRLTKTSHMGTLDPMVTGVLPITLGRACKLANFFMHRDKVYVGIMQLHEDVTDALLEKTAEQFLGKIMQLPPVRSRVKRALREREIKGFKILERDGKEVVFLSDVEAGTYIRKLIHDMGEQLGGAHMLELRRTKAGLFTEEDTGFVNLYDLEKAADEYEHGNDEKIRSLITPAEVALCRLMERVEVEEDAVKQLLTGKPIFDKDVKGKLIGEAGDTVAVFCKDSFIEVARIVKEKGIYAKPEFVFN